MIFLFVRSLVNEEAISADWIASELASQSATYAYIATSTSLFLAVIGYVVGRTLERLSVTSTTDPVTHIANRRGFEARLESEIARASQVKLPTALLVIDVDHLKEINDGQGHGVGDAALRYVAEVIARACRARDFVARWGGDEFAVLMSRTRAVEALFVAERIHRALAALAAQHREGALPISVSIGVAEHDGLLPIAASSLFEAADRALYLAKEKGRNCTCMAPPLGTPPPNANDQEDPSGIRVREGTGVDEEPKVRSK